MGGCALNTAVALGALGFGVDLGGNWIGRDPIGKQLLKNLKPYRVRSLLKAHPKFPTPRCQCLVDLKGDRQFILEHRTVQIAAPALWKEAARLARTGAYSQLFLQAYVGPLSRGFLRDAGPLEDTWILTQDLEATHPLAPRVDAIQVSVPESASWTRAALEKIAAPYFRGRLTEVFVTGGSNGVAWICKGERAELFSAARISKVKDTTGCGDTFRAGLMAGTANGLSREKSILWGIHLAAQKARQYGSFLKGR